jgi:hypothetical protein
MTAIDMPEPADGTEHRHAGDPTSDRAGPSAEDAAIIDLALMLVRVAALAGKRFEDLLASLSEADLAALYLGCARRIRGMRGPRSLCPARTSSSHIQTRDPAWDGDRRVWPPDGDPYRLQQPPRR